MPGLCIYLNFENPPATEEDIKKAVYRLDYFIKIKVKDSIKPCFFRYYVSLDDELLQRIRKYISDIKITPMGVDKNQVRIIYGCSKSYPEPWLDDEQRVLIAVQKKEKKYHGIVLLIDSGTFLVHDLYIPTINVWHKIS